MFPAPNLRDNSRFEPLHLNISWGEGAWVQCTFTCIFFATSSGHLNACLTVQAYQSNPKPKLIAVTFCRLCGFSQRDVYSDSMAFVLTGTFSLLSLCPAELTLTSFEVCHYPGSDQMHQSALGRKEE